MGVIMNDVQLDALAFEYQRDYGAARIDLDVLDFLDDSFLKSENGVLSLSFPEQL